MTSLQSLVLYTTYNGSVLLKRNITSSGLKLSVVYMATFAALKMCIIIKYYRASAIYKCEKPESEGMHFTREAS